MALMRGKKKKPDQLSNDWVGIFSLGRKGVAVDRPNTSGIPTSAILCGGKERIRETWSCIKPKEEELTIVGGEG